jgi:hypothetical protein
MDHPVRVAFCPILFESNGGGFTDSGLPILYDDSDEGQQRRGRCDVAYDCGVCSLLHAWVERASQTWLIGWECDHCLKSTQKEDGKKRWLPGFYQSGREAGTEPHPDLPDFDNVDPDLPALSGCTRCGWQTSFLQLVLRPKA